MHSRNGEQDQENVPMSQTLFLLEHGVWKRDKFGASLRKARIQAKHNSKSTIGYAGFYTGFFYQREEIIASCNILKLGGWGYAPPCRKF